MYRHGAAWRRALCLQVVVTINVTVCRCVLLLLQLLFLAGMTITIGVQATIQFFSRKKNRKVGPSGFWGPYQLKGMESFSLCPAVGMCVPEVLSSSDAVEPWPCNSNPYGWSREALGGALAMSAAAPGKACCHWVYRLLPGCEASSLTPTVVCAPGSIVCATPCVLSTLLDACLHLGAQGSAFYLSGAGLVIVGWTMIGLCIEAYGFWLLFCEFLPTVLQFSRRVPFMSKVLDMPFLKVVSSSSITRGGEGAGDARQPGVQGDGI